jgi:hypothetical protein
MHSLWKTKGGTAGIPQNLKLADQQGRKTGDFDRLWRATFPTRDDLPDIVSTAEGKPSERFIEVFR